MNVLRLFILIAALALALPGFCQTDSAYVKVDSAVGNPASRKPKTVTKKDTTIGPSVKSTKGKNTVVKDSARLALEALPGKAAWSSAIIPGWGQIRNHRWWKVPFIYGGMVSVALAYDFNRRYYRDILHELQYRRLRIEKNELDKPETNDPDYERYGDQELISAQNFYRRNRDLSVLGFLAIHTINIIDAYVDAKFFRYDISDKLGVSVRPSLLATPPASFASATPVPALKLTISL